MSIKQNVSLVRRHLAVVAAGTTASVVAYAFLHSHRRPIHNEPRFTPSEVQFQTSSVHPTPQGWTGSVWSIRNDYPTAGARSYPALPGPTVPRGRLDAPWLDIDFASDPERYALTIKEYCFEGNRPVDFVVQKNTIRDWYHAAWMHTSDFGREPLKGLTYERAIPSLEFAKNQTSALQDWAIGFYNAAGKFRPPYGRTLTIRNGTKTSSFQRGLVHSRQLLLTTATDAEVPTMRGSPAWPAVIAQQPKPDSAPPSAKLRNDFASQVRLIQMDWAVRDERSPIGWVFGTFMYNGSLVERDPWDRLTPVGVQWGNDPQLTQKAFEAGDQAQQSWINPVANNLLKSLGGLRPFWGWNGRLNGPADNFVSACVSCHSVAQRNGKSGLTSCDEVAHKNGKWIPENWYPNSIIKATLVPVKDSVIMKWFRNIPAGEPFDARAISADYSLQLMIGWDNYQTWLKAQKQINFPGRRLLSSIVKKPEVAHRTGPVIKYDDTA